MTIPQLPEILSYPKILNLNDIPEMSNKLVYVIRQYQLNGIAVLIVRQDGNVYIKAADFSGKILNPNNNKLYQQFINNHSKDIIRLMNTAHIPKAIYYIIYDNKLRLVDMRTSIDKFAGPGMLRDLFAKVIELQECIKTTQLTSDVIKAINNGTGTFAGDLILKSSAFKTITRGVKPKLQMYPLYALVSRSV